MSRKNILFVTICIIGMIISVVVVVLMNSTQTIFQIPENKNWLKGWNYRKSHIINGSPGAGTNYQMKIITHYSSGTDKNENVYLESICQPNFDDIRFTANDGVTLLDYWLETKKDKDYAVFWVEINDNLDTNQKIYLYYGNSTVSSVSNMENTFPFADDFSGTVLEPSKWHTFGSGKVTLKNGNCVLESAPQNYGWIYLHGKTLVESNYSLRFHFFVIEQGNERWTHHGFGTIYNTSNKQGGRTDEYPNYALVSQEAQYYAWTFRNKANFKATRIDMSSKAPAAATLCTYEIQRNGTTNVLFYCNDALQATISTNVPTVAMGAVFSADNAGLKLYSVTSIDWVLIRKFISNEPQHDIWGEQETNLR